MAENFPNTRETINPQIQDPNPRSNTKHKDHEENYIKAPSNCLKPDTRRKNLKNSQRKKCKLLLRNKDKTSDISLETNASEKTVEHIFQVLNWQ